MSQQVKALVRLHPVLLGFRVPRSHSVSGTPAPRPSSVLHGHEAHQHAQMYTQAKHLYIQKKYISVKRILRRIDSVCVSANSFL